MVSISPLGPEMLYDLEIRWGTQMMTGDRDQSYPNAD